MSEICKVHDLHWNFITNKWSKNIKLQHAHTQKSSQNAERRGGEERGERRSKWSPYFALQLHLRHLFKASGIKLRYSFDPPFSFCCFLFFLLLSLCRVSLFLRSVPCARGRNSSPKLCKLSVFDEKHIQRSALHARRRLRQETRLAEALLWEGHCCWQSWLEKGYINVMAGEKHA